MSDKNKGIWNGGKTNASHNEILRGLEDRYDIEDSEREFRKDLEERQKIMDKTKIEKKPLHELYTNIDYEEKTPVTGMGGRGGPIASKKNRK